MKKSTLAAYRKFVKVENIDAERVSREAESKVTSAETELEGSSEKLRVFEAKAANMTKTGVSGAHLAIIAAGRSQLTAQVDTHRTNLASMREKRETARAGRVKARMLSRRCDKIETRMRRRRALEAESAQQTELDEISATRVHRRKRR